MRNERERERKRRKQSVLLTSLHMMMDLARVRSMSMSALSLSNKKMVEGGDSRDATPLFSLLIYIIASARIAPGAVTLMLTFSPEDAIGRWAMR